MPWEALRHRSPPRSMYLTEHCLSWASYDEASHTMRGQHYSPYRAVWHSSKLSAVSALFTIINHDIYFIDKESLPILFGFDNLFRQHAFRSSAWGIHARGNIMSSHMARDNYFEIYCHGHQPWPVIAATRELAASSIFYFMLILESKAELIFMLQATLLKRHRTENLNIMWRATLLFD